MPLKRRLGKGKSRVTVKHIINSKPPNKQESKKLSKGNDTILIIKGIFKKEKETFH